MSLHMITYAAMYMFHCTRVIKRTYEMMLMQILKFRNRETVLVVINKELIECFGTIQAYLAVV